MKNLFFIQTKYMNHFLTTHYFPSLTNMTKIFMRIFGNPFR